MKKLTKLTALALALALILGMTAMAGTPSELIMVDDFTDGLVDGVPNLDKFTANRTQPAFINVSGSTINYFKFNEQITDGVVPGTKYRNAIGYDYYQNSGVLTQDEAGNVIYTGTSTGQRNNKAQLGYAFPEAWTYNEEYALVAQIGWIPYGANNAGGIIRAHNASDIAPVGAIITTAKTDAETGAKTESTFIRNIMGIYSDQGSNTIGFYQGPQAHTTNYSATARPVAFGTYSTIATVIRPYKNIADENVVDVEDDSLNILNIPGRVNTGDPYHTTAYDPVTKVSGIWYTNSIGFNLGLHNFKLYKVSLDPNDFAVVEASKAQTNVLTDAEIEIEFTQPVSLNGYYNLAQGRFITDLVITDAEGNTVSAENYTVEIDERIDGTAVKGVVTIIPKSNWAFGTTYTVTLPDMVKSIARIGMPAENKGPITFTTVAAPKFTMTLDAYKGLSATGTALTALEAGTTYFAVSAIQSEGVALTNGTVRIEILDADGNVVKYATAKKEFGATGATFGAAFKLEAGQTAKAFVVGVNGVATK